VEIFCLFVVRLSVRSSVACKLQRVLLLAEGLIDGWQHKGASYSTCRCSVKSTNVVCPHNGTYDLCTFALFSRTGFVDIIPLCRKPSLPCPPIGPDRLVQYCTPRPVSFVCYFFATQCSIVYFNLPRHF